MPTTVGRIIQLIWSDQAPKHHQNISKYQEQVSQISRCIFRHRNRLRAMAGTPSMWKLHIPGETLLALLLTKDSHKDTLALAKNSKRQNFTTVETSGPEGWTERMRLARSCLHDEQADYHSIIVDGNGIAAMGLGSNKNLRELAAYLAHMISDTSPTTQALLPAELKSAALSAPSLQSKPWRYDLTSEKHASRKGGQYAVVWHVAGKEWCRGWFHEDKTQVQTRFEQLRQGPYAAVVLDPFGAIVDRFGNFKKSHHIWKEMTDWWRQRTCPPWRQLAKPSADQATSPRSRSRSPRGHGQSRSQWSEQSCASENFCESCKEGRPLDYKFCHKCGANLEAGEVEAVGFVLDGGETVFCQEDDWEWLRQLVRERTPVKVEDGCDDMGVGRVESVEEVSIDTVLCLQSKISRHFKNRRHGRLEDLIAELESGKAHPMRTPWLVLNMAKASWVDYRTNSHITKYYTFDHRRLYCMWRAGFQKIRAKIVLEGSLFNEFARKADPLGNRIEVLDRRVRRNWIWEKDLRLILNRLSWGDIWMETAWSCREYQRKAKAFGPSLLHICMLPRSNTQMLTLCRDVLKGPMLPWHFLVFQCAQTYQASGLVPGWGESGCIEKKYTPKRATVIRASG